MGESFREIVELFVSQTAIDLDKIEKAIEANDTEASRMASHAIKSNCATLGFSGMRDIMQQMEKLSSDGDLQGVAILHENAREHYLQAVDMLKEL